MRKAGPFTEIRIAPKPLVSNTVSTRPRQLAPLRSKKNPQSSSHIQKQWALPWVPSPRVIVSLVPGMPAAHRDRLNAMVRPSGPVTLDIPDSNYVGPKRHNLETDRSPFPQLPQLPPPSGTDTAADSETDTSSESGSSIASQTSATSFDTDSVEALLRVLVDDGSLQYLWPQLVQMTGAALSARVIQDFVEQYADDLCREAASPLESKTSYFVRGHATSISRRITSVFVYKSNSPCTAEEETAWHVREEANKEELVLMTNLEYFKPDIRLVEAFLFESAAFEALQARVEAYVHANDTAAPNELGLSSTFRLGLQLAMAKGGVDELLAPVAKPGTTRLKFTCVSQPGYPSKSSSSPLPYSLTRT